MATQISPVRSLAWLPTGAHAEDKVCPADCLLLAGTCIAEEAVLTGESTPQVGLRGGEDRR